VRLITAISGLTLLAAAAAHGQVSFDVVESDLSRTPAQILSITDDAVTWLDAAGQPVTRDTGTILGLDGTRGEERSETATVFDVIAFEPSMLVLVDGRRYTGTLSGEAGLPETLRWQHPVLGKVDVPLEMIDRLMLQRASLGPVSGESLPPAEAQDVLLLRNGDRLEGFVAALDRDAVIEVDGREVAVPMETVYQVALANPRERWAGPMVWLRDGSVLGAGSVRLAERRFTLIDNGTPGTEADAGAGEAVVRAEHVLAVAFDTRELVPVSSLIESPSRRVSVRDARSPFDAEPIELTGAASLSVDLPAGASRLSMTAALPLRARAWGRFEVVLSTDGIVRARLPLSASRPEIDHELDLAGARELTITLETGEFGRVHAMAELREALIAID
jgi:hypothetical protein